MQKLFDFSGLETLAVKDGELIRTLVEWESMKHAFNWSRFLYPLWRQYLCWLSYPGDPDSLWDRWIWRNIVNPRGSKVARLWTRFAVAINIIWWIITLHRLMRQFQQSGYGTITDHYNWSPSKDLAGRCSLCRKKYCQTRVTGNHCGNGICACPLLQSKPKGQRIYRKITVWPLLELFVLDMRSYRGETIIIARSRPTLIPPI